MKSLNKVQLIGHVTHDPELKYTPTGAAVCNFSVATNRQWTTDTGEKREEADFHRLVAWNKLAEICGNLVKKGRKVYVEGRLATRSWQDKDGQTKYMTEVVLSDMILLDSKPTGEVASSPTEEFNVPDDKKEEPKAEETSLPAQAGDDIPF